MIVPTNDGEVKLLLRHMGEPICFFGENVAERRVRLREFMAKAEVCRYCCNSLRAVNVFILA